jgi:hypothetical protein
MIYICEKCGYQTKDYSRESFYEMLRHKQYKECSRKAAEEKVSTKTKGTAQSSAALENMKKVSDMIMDKMKADIKAVEDAMPSDALGQYQPTVDKSSSDAARKPLLEMVGAIDQSLDGKQYPMQPMYFYQDVVAAVQKHRERKFQFTNNPHNMPKCRICGKEKSMTCYAPQGYICYECACDEDFGKVEK